MVGETFLVIVTGGFAVSHSHGGIKLVVGSHVPRCSEFRVEEVEVFVSIVNGLLVGRTLNFIADEAILHIGKEVQTLHGGEVGTYIGITVGFGARVTIIFVFGTQIAEVVFYPKDATVVVAFVAIEAHARSDVPCRIFIVE